MKNKVIWGLVVLNLALLACLTWRMTADNTAKAQAARRPTDVIMIPGDLPSGTNSVLYLVDVGNHQLSAMAYDQGNIEFLSPPLDLDRLFSNAAGTVGGTGTTPPANTGRGTGGTGGYRPR